MKMVGMRLSMSVAGRCQFGSGQGWLSSFFDVSGLIRDGRVWYELGWGWSVEVKIFWHLIWVGPELVKDGQECSISNLRYLRW